MVEGSHRPRRHAERRVVGQDVMLELLQLRSRVEAELVGQLVPDPLVRGQRVGLASGPVLGGDQQLPQPLLVRGCGHRGLQLTDHVGGVSEPQPGREPGLDEDPSCLFETGLVREDPLAVTGGRQHIAAVSATASTRTARRRRGGHRRRADATPRPHRAAPPAHRPRTARRSSVYPPSPLATTGGSPRARRSLAIFDCNVLRCVVAASAAHRSSTRRSVRTTSPASRARRTSSSDVLPPGTGSTWPSRRTSSGPRTRPATRPERTARSTDVLSPRPPDGVGGDPGHDQAVRVVDQVVPGQRVDQLVVVFQVGPSDRHHLSIPIRRGHRRGPIEPVRSPLEEGSHGDQDRSRRSCRRAPRPTSRRRCHRRSRFGSWRQRRRGSCRQPERRR